MLSRVFRRFAGVVLTGVAMSGLLAGCGGSGAGAGGPGGTEGGGSVGPTSGAILVVSSAATINSDGKTPVDLTAVVTSASNLAVSGATVEFSAVDKTGSPGSVRVEVVRQTTDASGTALARLWVQGDTRNRDITITARTGSLSSTPITVKVSDMIAQTSGTIVLLGSGTTLNSDGKTPVDLTAVITSASGVAVQGAPVEFSLVDSDGLAGGARLEVLSAVTDAAGAAKARLSLQGDQRLRNIVVTAKSGTLSSQSLTIGVFGTTLAVSGPSSLALSDSVASAYTVTLLDSSGGKLAGKTVTASSRAGNRWSATSVTTDASGQAKFNLFGNKGGADTLTFNALGVTRSLDITVATQSMSIAKGTGFLPTGVGEADTPENRLVVIGTQATLNLSYQSLGGIAPGTQAEVSTTRGTVTPSSGSVQSGGATFTVSSTTPGPATVTARVGGLSVEYQFNFVAVTSAQIDLQPSIATLGPNLGGSTEQRSTLTAVVRDASGNPVANRTVTFQALKDPSGGSIVPGTAKTDLAGRATAAFIAGPNTTAANGVSIRATVDGIPSNEVLLSVARSQLFVRIETDNKIEKVEPAIYRKTYAVIVTDATGNPVADASVQMSLRPTQYRTGRWSSTTGFWEQLITATLPSEDINRDGICSAGEDTNGDRQLTPGNVASAPTSVKTGANGIAGVDVQYPRGFSMWTEMVLEARIQVAGTEGVASSQFWLPIASDDINDIKTSPPGLLSPFPYPSGSGIASSCP